MKKYTIAILIFISLVITGFFLLLSFNNKRARIADKSRNRINIELSGRIISKEEKRRWGRERIICCVDMSYSNIDSIYIYDTQYYIAVKIKDKIATFVLPYDAYDADSVEININNNRIEKYFKDGILLTERPISFESAYIAERDLKTCN